MSGERFLPFPLPLAYVSNGLILSVNMTLLHFLRKSLIGLISSDNFGRNCTRYITQRLNDLIPLAVLGIGSVEMALTCEPKGVMVSRLSLLDNNNPIYFTLDQKVWILLIVKSMPYVFNISIKLLITFLCVLISVVKMMTSSIMQLMYSQMSEGKL